MPSSSPCSTVPRRSHASRPRSTTCARASATRRSRARGCSANGPDGASTSGSGLPVRPSMTRLDESNRRSYDATLNRTPVHIVPFQASGYRRGDCLMALVRINPIEARVTWDRGAARPARIRVADRDLTVTSLTARRDELAAYPVDRGPRVTYLVETEH